MALLHDLAEAVTGDITQMMKQPNHLALENQSMSQILSGLDEPQRRLYWETWLEYQRNESPEAVLVHDADKLEMVQQVSEYQSSSPDSRLDRFWHAMVSKDSKEIVEKIRERSPR